MIEGVQVISPQMRYIYVNDAVARHAKRSREELTGSTMIEMFPGIEQSELYGIIQNCFRENTSKEWINEFDFPDGSKGYFLLRMELIEEGVLIMSFDVTDQKRAELLIKESNAQLEELVKTRTSELEQQNLIIEKQLEHLRELNDTKDKFFSIVAHDLMSPLSSLKAISELMASGLESDDKDEMVHAGEQVKETIDNTIKLAQNLITWARVQMHEQQTSAEKVVIADLVQDILRVYIDLATKKGIKLISKVDDTIQTLGDRNQIAFIIRNLINNAIKFTRAGGSIEIKGNVISNEFIQIEVKDSGVGMSDTLKNEILTLENKTSAPGTAGEQGTGLGLILCHEFVKLNGGRLKIESKRDIGTSINVTLKRVL